MSSPSLFSSPFLSPSPPFHPSGSTSAQRHTPPHRDHFRSEARPRLSSPRLFRDFFSSVNEPGERRQAVLPPAPGPYRQVDDTRSFPDAIQRTSRAMRNTGQAFESRAARGAEVVDLTDSPPAENTFPGRRNSRDGSDFHFATTTHPQDSGQPARGLGPLHEPIFGYSPIAPYIPLAPVEDPTDSLVRARNRRNNRLAQAVGRVSDSHRRADERSEREAVRRQQQNHEAWQRTQQRMRQLQEEELSLPASLSSSPAPSSINSLFESSLSPTPETMPSTKKIESVDLTSVNDDKALADTLSKQRTDAIEAQKPNTATEAGRTTFTAYKCPVCMDNLKDATTTVCGHLFCHHCIIDTLNWSASQRKQDIGGGTRKINGVCPVCRKPLACKDNPGSGRTLVTLEMRFLTKKRKRDDKGKARADEPPPKRKRSKRAKRESSDDFFNRYTNDVY